MADGFQLTARTGHPGLVELPWSTPLAEWDDPRLLDLVRGVARHEVRAIALEGRAYFCKETEVPLARHEYGVLRHLADVGLPAVEAVAVVAGRHDPAGAPLPAVLVTRQLEHSLPYRYLFAGRGLPDARSRLLDALVVLLVRMHLEGVFWGDCSLSNTLFRRDAGALAAHLVDAETAEVHPAGLSAGQRRHDLELALENVAGELLDLAAASRRPTDVDPMEAADDLAAGYAALWDELTGERLAASDGRSAVEGRIERLHALGFDVDEVEVVRGGDGGDQLRVRPRVVELGHHARELRRLTGLDVQEGQARRLLNDVAAFSAAVARETGAAPPTGVAAARWLAEVFAPAVAAVPEELRGRREPAEVFHEVLEHRWFLSEARGDEVGTDEAVRSYVDDVLPHLPDERRLLPDGEADDPA